MTLTHSEFIRRFLLHVLPRGFTLIRYYGFFSAPLRKKSLLLCRDHLLSKLEFCTQQTDELEEVEEKQNHFKCPKCGCEKMSRYQEILPEHVTKEIKTAA
jgi:predicted RNA-binding Zn-ribbon protein involved in translation (DUF1610 family)